MTIGHVLCALGGFYLGLIYASLVVVSAREDRRQMSIDALRQKGAL